MLTKRVLPAAQRRIRHSATAPRPVSTYSGHVSETPGIPVEKLVWLASYLRSQKETSDIWILSEMGWLMENTTQILAEIISKSFDRILHTITATIDPLIIARTSLLNIETIQSKLTANSVAIEIECNYRNTITGAHCDIDKALQLLLYVAPQLCEKEDNIQQQFTLLDHCNASRLHISHPATEVPPEMFDYLFNYDKSCRNADDLDSIEILVQKCCVQYNLAPDNRHDLIVLTITSSIGLVPADTDATDHLWMPLTATFQCTIGG